MSRISRGFDHAVQWFQHEFKVNVNPKVLKARKVLLEIPTKVKGGGKNFFGEVKQRLSQEDKKANKVAIQKEILKQRVQESQKFAKKEISKTGRFNLLKLFTKKNAKLLAEVAVEEGTHSNITPLKAGDIEAGACRVVDGKVVQGELCSTSMRGTEDEDHLMNAWITRINNKPTLVIRTAVIDTEQKAQELLVLIKEVVKENSLEGAPVRILSNQLNSPDKKNEAKMVRRQHYFLSKLNLPEKFSIAHINTPMNRFYLLTTNLNKMGPLGRFFAKNFLPGEKISHAQNYEGLTEYAGWIVDDIEELPKVSDTISGIIGDLREQFKESSKISNEYKALIQDTEELNILEEMLKNETHPRKKFELDEKKQIILNRYGRKKAHLEKQVKQKRKELKDSLNKTRIQLAGMRNVTENIQNLPNVDKKLFQNAHMKLTLFTKLLGNQLEVKGEPRMTRVTEGQTIDLLNHLMGVVSQRNCKSGIDRALISYAMRIGLEKIIQKHGEERAFNMIQNFEKDSFALNQLYNAFNSGEFGTINPKNDAQTDILEFREHILNIFLEIGIPISAFNTGLIGLKYGKGQITENPHPLMILPPYVQDTDGSWKKIFTIDKKGKPTLLTEEGHQLITILSANRGA